MACDLDECDECVADLKPSWRFCPQCGTRRPGRQSEWEEALEQVAALVVALDAASKKLYKWRPK